MEKETPTSPVWLSKKLRSMKMPEATIKQMLSNLCITDTDASNHSAEEEDMELYDIVEGSLDDSRTPCSDAKETEDIRTTVENEKKTPEAETPKSAREAVEMAIQLNTMLSHENFGALSFSHGFAPMVTPTPKLPKEFKAWDEFSEKMPQLLSSGRFRLYCETELPHLDPTNLPHQYSLRATQILGYAIHAYWNLGGLKTPTSVPPALDEPWTILCTQHLDRPEAFMGFHELLIHAFWFDKDKDQNPPSPSKEHTCPYKSEKDGCVEYNPLGVKLGGFSSTMSLTGSQAEYVFYGSMTEMHCQGAGLVLRVVEAQEAAEKIQNSSSEEEVLSATNTLEEALADIKDLLDSLTLGSFAKIQQMQLAEFYVDPSIWSKVVAPVAVPIFQRKVGPSGTAAPLFIALDAFFGRTKYSNYVGQEMKVLTKSLPLNLKRFVDALRNGPNVGAIVSAHGKSRLKGTFSACLRAYASDDGGFLGRHTLKMTGYLEVGMKLGRSVTLGGFGGLLKDRAWETATKHLRDAQEDRFELGLDAETTLCQTARVIPNKGTGDSCEQTYHVRIDISESGIRYRPGDRVGVLWEASDELIRRTIHAIANGSSVKASEIEEALVMLNDNWKKALRCRPRYYKAKHAGDRMVIPDSLPLREFLRYARLRPASRECVRTAYQATLDPWLYGFLQSGREAMLEASDVLKLIYRTHPTAGDILLRNNLKRKARDSIFLRQGFTNSTGTLETGYDRLFHNADANNDGFLDKSEVLAISNLIHGKNSTDVISHLFSALDLGVDGVIEKDEFIEMAKLGLVKLPMLCELLEPANFRVYSVASANCATPAGELHLCVSKVKYAQKDPTSFVSPLLADLQPTYERRGAASSYLGQLCQGDLPPTVNRKITIRHFQPPCFQLPPENLVRASVLMFAAGSGIAPFRSFWQALATRHSKAIESGKAPPPKALLVLQAKSRPLVPFVRELASLVGAGLLDAHICLSREDFTADFSKGEPNWIAGKRGYVQDEIAKEDSLYNRIASELSTDGKGHVYVCSGGGFAKTVIDAIDGVVGEAAAERMMASGRLSLEVFTSLRGPDSSLKDTWISDFIFCNDFNGREASFVGERSSKNLWLVIDGLIYDVDAFASKHPGGRQLLYLYCGTDASKPWISTGHYKAPEVASLLEMYLVGRLRTKDRDTNLLTSSIRLRKLSTTHEENVKDGQLSPSVNGLSKCPFSQKNLYSATDKQFLTSDDCPFTPQRFSKKLSKKLSVSKLLVPTLSEEDSFEEDASAKVDEIEKNEETTISSWYSDAWLPLTYLLVEAQNAVTLAFMSNWDNGVFTSAEPHEQDCHFCTWDGISVLRPKRSVLKGQMLADAHRRVWFEYIPTILGDEFLSAIAPLTPESVRSCLQTLAASSMHREAAALVPLLEEVTDALGEQQSCNGYVPAPLHAVLEATRCTDERVLSFIKVGVSKALKAFESYQPAIVFADEEEEEIVRLVSNVEAAVVEIILALENYCVEIRSLVREGFREYNASLMSNAIAALNTAPNLGCVSRFERKSGKPSDPLTLKRNLVGVGNVNAKDAFVETMADHQVADGEGRSIAERSFERQFLTRQSISSKYKNPAVRTVGG